MMDASSRPASITKLSRENVILRAQFAEAQEVLRAIRSDDVDAVIVSGPDVGQVKKKENLIGEGQRLLAAIVESSEDAIYTRSLDGVFTTWNRGAEHLFGYTAAEAVGQKMTLVATPEHLQEVYKMVERVKQGVHIRHLESVRICKDGRRVEVSVSLSPLRNERGEVTGVSVVARDITERKSAEKREKRLHKESELTLLALEESEARFQNLVEASPDAIFVHCEGKIVFANSATLKMFGAETPEQVVGKAVLEFVHPDYVPLIKKRIETDLLSGPASAPMESVHVRLDGSLVDVEGIGIPITWQGSPAIEVLARDVTERKRARQYLEESETRFRNLVEASPDAIFVHCEGKIVFANPATLKLLGAENLEQILGTPCSDLLHPDYRELIARQIETDMRLGMASCPLECVYLRLDGSPVHVETIGIPISWQGSPAIEVIARDITERKKAQRTVLEWKQRLELAEKAALPIGLWEWDFHTHTLVWSDEVYRQMGHTHDSFRGLEDDYFDRLHPEDRSRVETALQPVSSGLSQRYENQFRVVRPDGSVCWLDSRGVFVEGSSRMIGISIDVTKLRRSEADYRSIVETAPYGLFCSTVDDRFLVVNPALIKMLGYECESEVLPLNIARDIYCNPEERAQLTRQLIENGYLKNVESNWKRKDGSTISVIISAVSVCNTAGEIESLQGFVQDVTEHKSLARQLWQSQKMEAIGRLAGGIAHDFNNVLMVVGSYAELIKGRKINDDKVNSFADQIQQSARRAVSITRQLLAFSRQQVLEPEILDLNDIVAELGKVLPRLLGEDIEVVTTLEPVLHRVRLDRGQVEQIIVNLAVNSRDAMPKGGHFEIKTENIELDAASAAAHFPMNPGPYIKLSIVDSGSGMSAETKSHLFEPFFTTKERGQGTGLGLATVYGIVKQSGGFIWVTSDIGCGTTFEIDFPRVQEPIARPSTQNVPAATSEVSETILLVEDEANLRGVVCEYLRSNGYRVIVAGGGAEAIRICEQHVGTIDLLLTDLVMPGMDGTEVAKVVAARYPGIHIVCMSGYTERAVGLLGARAVLLKKPFSLSELGSKLRAVFAAHNGTNALITGMTGMAQE